MNRRKVLLAGCGGIAALGPANLAQASSEPIPGVDIIVKKKPPRKTITMQTGKEGLAVFKRLPAGEYDVNVRAGSGTAIRVTVTAGKQEPVMVSSKTGTAVTAIMLKETAAVRVLVEGL